MNLPKFLFAADSDYAEDSPREFVIHNHWPSFIMEFVDGVGTPHFYDPEAAIIATEPPLLISLLMREAEGFYSNRLPIRQ